MQHSVAVGLTGGACLLQAWHGVQLEAARVERSRARLAAQVLLLLQAAEQQPMVSVKSLGLYLQTTIDRCSCRLLAKLDFADMKFSL